MSTETSYNAKRSNTEKKIALKSTEEKKIKKIFGKYKKKTWLLTLQNRYAL